MKAKARILLLAAAALAACALLMTACGSTPSQTSQAEDSESLHAATFANSNIDYPVYSAPEISEIEPATFTNTDPPNAY